MIVISALRTARLDVRLQELSFGAEIALCHLPEKAHEQAMSEFLRRAIEEAGTPSDKHVSDPRAWTVAERLRALTHYNVHAREDGPDYAVTESSKLSDYLDAAREPAKPSTFAACKDNWVFHPLTGAMAETIEAMQHDSGLKGRAHWLTGVMAAQLLRDGEAFPDPVAEGADYSTWLRRRMAVMCAMPSSDIDALYAGFRAANETDTQFFRLWFDEEGVIVMPKGVAGNTPAARFLIHSAVGELALAITGKS